MERKRGRLDFNNEASEIGKRHRAEKRGWKKERLLAIKLLLEGGLDIAAVAHLVGRHRNSINDLAARTSTRALTALADLGGRIFFEAVTLKVLSMRSMLAALI